MDGSSDAAVEGGSTLLSWSALLSAPSLTPFLPSLDEGALARLYGQPPPIAHPHAATPPTPSAVAAPSSWSSAAPVASTSAAASALAQLDGALLRCIERAWHCGLQADCGPPPAPTAHSDAATASPSARSSTPLVSAVSAFLSSLSALDAAARACDASVPSSLVGLIDEGANPQASLALALKAASNHNDAVRGRIAAAHHALHTAQLQLHLTTAPHTPRMHEDTPPAPPSIAHAIDAP